MTLKETALPPTLSTTTSKLQARLSSLQKESLELSEELTSSLSNSPSGQALLQIGHHLSSLPHDLHQLQATLGPMLAALDKYQAQIREEWDNGFDSVKKILLDLRRVQSIQEARELISHLDTAEKCVARAMDVIGKQDVDLQDILMGLEQAVYTVNYMKQLIQQCTASAALPVTPAKPMHRIGASINDLPNIQDAISGTDTERSKFLLKLHDRVRQLESDIVEALGFHFEALLSEKLQTNKLLLVSQCLRSFVLLGRGADAEAIFSKTAILPLLKSKVTIGKIDEGGSRGQCTGLFSLLDDIGHTIASNYGKLFLISEIMFDAEETDRAVDLITKGVWSPIVKTFVNDSSIRMAVFSPGIADAIQANFIAFNAFKSELVQKLLKHSEVPPELEMVAVVPNNINSLIEKVQQRMFNDSITQEFMAKWSLPIYYQLRFGEACSKLNKCISRVEEEGWRGSIFTGNDEAVLRDLGFELEPFMEVYGIIHQFWKPDVFLAPLTHRFMRGSIQLLGRFLKLISDGLIEDRHRSYPNNLGESELKDTTKEKTYIWHNKIDDIASVAWDLSVLQVSISSHYLTTIFSCFDDDEEIIKSLECNILPFFDEDILRRIQDLVRQCWDCICSSLLERCSAPLVAVKGISATYRMTNRPLPSLPSPFVSTILRPLEEFDREFSDRTPSFIAFTWKQDTVSKISEIYSSSVEELITTVKQTEEALRKRKTKRVSTMSKVSDGDKVMKQLYLDYLEFETCVGRVGVEPSSVPGLMKLQTLTQGGSEL